MDLEGTSNDPESISEEKNSLQRIINLYSKNLNSATMTSEIFPIKDKLYLSSFFGVTSENLKSYNIGHIIAITNPFPEYDIEKEKNLCNSLEIPMTIIQFFDGSRDISEITNFLLNGFEI